MSGILDWSSRTCPSRWMSTPCSRPRRKSARLDAGTGSPGGLPGFPGGPTRRLNQRQPGSRSSPPGQYSLRCWPCLSSCGSAASSTAWRKPTSRSGLSGPSGGATKLSLHPSSMAAVVADAAPSQATTTLTANSRPVTVNFPVSPVASEGPLFFASGVAVMTPLKIVPEVFA